jgi:preprotein translocase subunit SecA
MSFFNILSKIFGTRNERKLKFYKKQVEKINKLETEISELSDAEIIEKKQILKDRFEAGETLLDLLPESFAIVREVSKRTLKMRHFDVQLIGGMVLNDGMIAEMKTGEGKTLVATLTAYLNSIAGKVHVVTANDYLAKRDATHLKPLYDALGVSSTFIISSTPVSERQVKYNHDVIYTTNNDLGFDYLRDNMRINYEEMSLITHELKFAIIDEIDSILIDEARTPLIISGEAEQNFTFYNEAFYIISKLEEGDYEIDEKQKSAYLTENGYTKIETELKKMGIIANDETLFGEGSYIESILKPEVYFRNGKIIHFINQALRAEKLFKKDVDYIVKDKKVLIIDEFTGRISEGRRFGNGLHGALEAKHKLPVEPETQTIASITYQNYFRMYKKLAGMTGTASTEAEEFREIYKLDVVSIPTNKKVIRVDEDDVIYKTENEKFNAIVEFVKDLQAKGQPVLIGTVSIHKSEILSNLFKKNNLKHNVLNAKFHEKEAEIIADAGRKGAITIATNMAGRGTDIMLGGNLEKKLSHTTTQAEKERIVKEHEEEAEEVKKAGGLFILASERHESRRIDNQLRGRSGRQGDIGYSKFFLSLQDDLLRIFGGKMLESLLSKMGFKEGEAMHHTWLNSVIEKAQKKVEAHNFEIRKNLLKYDNMLNEQRQIIYSKRLTIVKTEGTVNEEMESIITEELESIFEALTKTKDSDETDINIASSIKTMFNISEEIALEGDANTLKEKALLALNQIYAEKTLKEEFFTRQKMILLKCLDYSWKEHLYGVDNIKSKISLRSYVQKDPLNEYKLELFKAFEEMFLNYRKLVIINTFKSSF